MKIDRLIGILSVLLQQEKTTAPYLAEKFEVSRRTINRDIEDLCKAGIPIVTVQGVNGGISIMEGFTMDRTLLTASDMQAVLAGLRSLDSVSGTNRYGQLMEKFAAGASDMLTEDQYVLIDLSSWYKDLLAPKIELLHTAIKQREEIRFLYSSQEGEKKRRIEPYYLVFQWANWYVYGWCTTRKDFRMFKLNRMEDLCFAGKGFEKRQVPVPDFKTEKVFPPKLQVEARFSPECKWRLQEEFGRNSFTRQEDGTLLFSFGFADKENLLTWILTFGGKVELLKPEELRQELLQAGREIAGKYTDVPVDGKDAKEKKELHLKGEKQWHQE